MSQKSNAGLGSRPGVEGTDHPGRGMGRHARGVIGREPGDQPRLHTEQRLHRRLHTRAGLGHRPQDDALDVDGSRAGVTEGGAWGPRNVPSDA